MGANILQIRVGLVNGANVRFQQDDSVLATKCVGRLHPDRIFAHSTVVLGGGHHVAAFPTAQIAHVEVRSELLPDWPFGANLESVELLNGDRFQRGIEAIADVSRRELRVASGEEVSGYALLESRGGFHYRLALRARALPTSARAGSLARILDGKVLYARDRDGNAFLINIANVVSLRIYPGMPELPPHALDADEIVSMRPEIPD